MHDAAADSHPDKAHAESLIRQAFAYVTGARVQRGDVAAHDDWTVRAVQSVSSLIAPPSTGPSLSAVAVGRAAAGVPEDTYQKLLNGLDMPRWLTDGSNWKSDGACLMTRLSCKRALRPLTTRVSSLTGEV